MKISKKGLRLFFIYVLCILIAIATLFPIYWTFIISAQSKLEIFSGPNFFPSTFHSENYTRPFLQDVYGRYLANSLIVATGNTLLVIVLAVMSTYAFSVFRSQVK